MGERPVRRCTLVPPGWTGICTLEVLNAGRRGSVLVIRYQHHPSSDAGGVRQHTNSQHIRQIGACRVDIRGLVE